MWVNNRFKEDIAICLPIFTPPRIDQLFLTIREFYARVFISLLTNFLTVSRLSSLGAMRILLLSVITLLIPASYTAHSEKPKNVVFIILDDFRPAIRAAGDTTAYTPNLDKLVKSSFYFENCFSQVSSIR